MDLDRRNFLKYAGIAGVASGLTLANARNAFASTVLANDYVQADAIRAPTGRSATIVVAASDSSAKSKAQADYVCDGTDDQVEIQAAITASTGDIYFAEGVYSVSGVGISLPSNTHIRLNNNAVIKFNDTVGDDGVIFVNSDEVNGNRNISIKGGVLDGNKSTLSASTSQTAIKLTKVTKAAFEVAIRNIRGKNIDADDDSVYNWINTDYPLGTPIKEGYDSKNLMNIGWRILNNFEDAAEWLGETAFDTEIFYSGTKSARCTVAANSGAALKTLCCTLPTCRFDPTRYTYRLKLRTDNPGRLTSASVQMYMPNSNNRITHSLSVTGMPANAWYTSYGTRAYETGSPNRSNIVSLNIALNIADGPAEINVYVDQLEILPSISKTGLISFMIDGQYDQQFTKIAPILRKYGIKGVTFPTPEILSSDGRLADMKQLQRDGWDILAHTRGENVTTLSEAENELYRMAEINYMLSNGFPGVRNGCAPLGGHMNDTFMKNALKYYHLVRGVSGIACKASIPPVASYGTSEGFITYSAGTEDSGSMATYKSLMDDAARTGTWLQMYCHRIDSVGSDPASLSSAEYIELIEYALSIGLKFVTVSDVLNMIREGESLFSHMQGTATITSGQTSVAVSHGLTAAPTSVILSPITDTAGKRYYVSAKAASTFTITIDNAAEADISFDWSAVV